jgi:hypothetical protein
MSSPHCNIQNRFETWVPEPDEAQPVWQSVLDFIGLTKEDWLDSGGLRKQTATL